MNEINIAIYLGVGFIIMLILLTVSVVLHAQRRRNQLKLKLSEEKIHQQKELTKNTIKSHEEERQRLGMELHDDLGQNLTFIKMSLSRYVDKHGKNGLENSIQVLEESIDKCSQLSKVLYPVVLKKFGLQNGILQLVHDLGGSSDLKIQTDIDNIELHKDQELHWYRITQELINNTLKYANAKNASVSIKELNGQVIYDYKDDGIGFDSKIQTKGLGLQNLETRAHGLLAKLDFQTGEGEGVTVHLEAPIHIATHMHIL